MSHQRFFLRPGFRLIAFVISVFYLSTTFGATAQSSATVSWATAFGNSTQAFTSYSAGVDPNALTELASFGTAPTDGSPQSINYGSVETGGSAFANSTSLFAESHALDGSAAIGVSMTAVFYAGDITGGLLTIEVPYTLTSLVQPGVGSSTVSIFASLGTIDAVGNPTGSFLPEPSVSLDNTGIGSPGDLTGMLFLQIGFDPNDDFAAILSINVLTESNAVPLKTVPIPGGIALAIPALLPLFASRKKKNQIQQS